MAQAQAINIDDLKTGSEESFRQLVEQYQGKVYNTCLGFAKNGEDADDLAQEVFIEVFKSINTFRGDAKLSTWIYRIAVTKSLEFLRKSKRRKRFGLLRSLFTDEPKTMLEIPEFEHPGILAENKERANILMSAIDKLPESQKTAFTLHKIEGLSYEAIGEIMNKSLSSIESIMHRAKIRLQEYLHDYYYNL